MAGCSRTRRAGTPAAGPDRPVGRSARLPPVRSPWAGVDPLTCGAGSVRLCTPPHARGHDVPGDRRLSRHAARSLPAADAAAHVAGVGAGRDRHARVALVRVGSEGEPASGRRRAGDDPAAPRRGAADGSQRGRRPERATGARRERPDRRAGARRGLARRRQAGRSRHDADGAAARSRPRDAARCEPGAPARSLHQWLRAADHGCRTGARVRSGVPRAPDRQGVRRRRHRHAARSGVRDRRSARRRHPQSGHRQDRRAAGRPTGAHRVHGVGPARRTHAAARRASHRPPPPDPRAPGPCRPADRRRRGVRSRRTALHPPAAGPAVPGAGWARARPPSAACAAARVPRSGERCHDRRARPWPLDFGFAEGRYLPSDTSGCSRP